MHRKDEVFWTRVFLFGATCVAGLIVARKRKLHRFHLHILKSKSRDYGRFFGMDIGGTLAKMVYFQPTDPSVKPVHHSATNTQTEGSLTLFEAYILGLNSNDRSHIAHREERLELVIPELGGSIHFLSSQTSKMDEILNFVRRRFFHRYIQTISCTGGGAFKFSRLFEEKLGIQIRKEDEMECLIRGLNFVLRYATNECFTYTDVVLDAQGLGQATKQILPTPEDDLYPFLLVNIGSGVSILKISGASEYERVSGTSLGGGTFWGLCKALSKLHTFDEAMDAAVLGNAMNVDMTVGDIYGDAGYEQFGLKPETVASSFGKIGMKTEPRSNVLDQDMARSLLFMLTQNLGQVAYLNARRVQTRQIYFCGNFLRRNEIASRQLAYAIDFWSKGAMQAQFFHHEGFFGALGSFLMQWEEYAGKPV